MTTKNGGKNDDTIPGSSRGDQLIGQDGSDVLRGGSGDDSLYGGFVATAMTDRFDGFDYLDGGKGDDKLYGGGQDDILVGGVGDDTLIGGLGDDELIGGDGKDVFVVTPGGYSQTDRIVDFDLDNDRIDLRALHIGSYETVQTLLTGGEFGSQGQLGTTLAFTIGFVQTGIVIDAIQADDLSAANFILSADSGKDAVSGTNQSDLLFGGGGSDTLAGLSGDEVLFGEDGNDRLYGGDSAGSNRFDGADTLWGGAGDDKLFGGSQNDLLIGGVGDDTLDGGTGTDELRGGNGKDLFVAGAVADGGSIVVDDFNAADDRLDLRALGISDLSMLRDLMAERFGGTVIGARYGGTGTAIQLQGVTTKSLTADDFIFYDEKHPLYSAGTNFADDLFGSKRGDAISGGGSDDRIWGGAGDDKLYGGVNVGYDTEAGGGSDILKGGLGDDTLYGGGDRDALVGGAGDDVLVGGLGNDILTGGTGKDMFVFKSVDHSPVSVGDTIRDFVHGTDRIDLKAIDAVTGGSDDAFKWIGDAVFSGAGQVRAVFEHGYTNIYGDVNGDGRADFKISLLGDIDLSKGDFVL